MWRDPSVTAAQAAFVLEPTSVSHAVLLLSVRFAVVRLSFRFAVVLFSVIALLSCFCSVLSARSAVVILCFRSTVMFWYFRYDVVLLSVRCDVVLWSLEANVALQQRLRAHAAAVLRVVLAWKRSVCVLCSSAVDEPSSSADALQRCPQNLVGVRPSVLCSSARAECSGPPGVVALPHVPSVLRA